MDKVDILYGIQYLPEREMPFPREVPLSIVARAIVSDNVYAVPVFERLYHQGRYYKVQGVKFLEIHFIQQRAFNLLRDNSNLLSLLYQSIFNHPFSGCHVNLNLVSQAYTFNLCFN